MAHFVAVAALDLGHIAWFSALATAVTPLVTVAALYDTLVDAVTLAMALFSAVAADIRGLGWAVTAHMADLAADVALDVGAWLRTLLGFVLLRSAVSTAATKGLAWLRAIARTMTVFVAVCAIDWHSNSLILVLFAIPDVMAKLIAAAALLDKAVHDNAGLSKASEIFLLRCWPAFGELGTPRLG